MRPTYNAVKTTCASCRNGLPIVFRADGYINMTKAARDFGKDLKEFFKNKGTKEYIKAMEVMGGIPPITLKQAKKGYHANPNVGTYGHPKLGVFFARWLDVRFAVWCDLMIDNILQGNIQTSVAVPTEEAVAVQAIGEEMKLENLRLKEENAALKADVVRLQESGLKTGEIPRGWLTAWTYLEDQGHGLAGASSGI